MRVLISGAGIAGPALAWHLAKTGASITIVEKSHALLPHGQNIDVNGSALTVIEKMGLMDQLRAYHTNEKGAQLIDPKGRPFAPFPVREGSSASPTSEFEILRGDLSKVVYEATRDCPNVEYVFGITITKVVSNGQDSVKVELSNGEVREYGLLVAADGQWSRLRKQCFPADAVTVIDKRMYAVYWTIPRLPGDNDMWNIYHALGSRILSIRPDPHGTMRAAFTHMPCNDRQETEWKEAARSDRQTQQVLVRKEFGDAGWQAERLLEAMQTAPDFYFQPVQQIKLAKWSIGRVICLGDAAYAPSPLTGAGASLALIGGYVLGGELSKLKDGEHPSSAFDAYECVFRPFVEQMQNLPSFVPGIAHPESAAKRWILQTFIAVLSRIVAIPWLVKWIDHDSNEQDFPLPRYPIFEGEKQLK
ncbi:Monooxygenase FAD-binding protein [Macrophomina phaseolina MS6]|uniref:Monooxygenase FAD-binding protein n=1 Tax=Macrophomina phaseolina (strain MS6) TaxID=1126212 RepID=K2RIS0_MACPH|nr:Monooxygenase FAD-binding protein [Macrophomina phaseolina MS6]